MNLAWHGISFEEARTVFGDALSTIVPGHEHSKTEERRLTTARRVRAGWSEIAPAPQPFARAGVVEVTWDETNRRRRLQFFIEGEDGRPSNVPTPTGERPFKIEALFDVGRPPGSPGRSLDLPIAVNVAPAAVDSRPTLRGEGARG